MQFLSVFFIHVFLYFSFEPVSLFDSLWHTYTIVTTVGFGDISATTVSGKITTMVFAFSLGIWLLANLVGILIDLQVERKRQKTLGNWSWKLNNAIVLIGSPKNEPESYFYNLLKQIRTTSKVENKDVLIVSTQFKDGLPDSIADLGAVLLNKKSDDKSLYEEDAIKSADIIYLIAKEERNGISNSITFNTLSLMQEYDINAHVIAETTKECDRERFIRMGADAVIRPIRAYPEMVVRAMINENNAMFIENMFSSEGDEPVVFDVVYQGQWQDVVIKCLEIDAGTPVGFIDINGRLVSNPSAKQSISAKGIQILVKDHCTEKQSAITKAFGSWKNAA